jgi:hypothetical protein
MTKASSSLVTAWSSPSAVFMTSLSVFTVRFTCWIQTYNFFALNASTCEWKV